jgi:FAD:protein FMN transferase
MPRGSFDMTQSPCIARARPLLGTYVELRVQVSAEGTAQALAAIAAGFDELERIERLMSWQRTDSDIARLNRAIAAGAIARKSEPLDALAVDWRTRAVLDIADELRRESRGVFDAGGTAGRAINLDGIAKGYAVDRATSVMRAAGALRGAVNAGGDLRIFADAEAFNGSRAGEPLFVRLPGMAPRILALGAANNVAVATSARSPNARRHADLTAGSLVDPRTGRKVDEDISVTVAASSCVLADALTKIVAIDPQMAGHCLRLYHASAWRHVLEPREELLYFDPSGARWLN